MTYQTESRDNIFGFSVSLDDRKLRRAIEEKAEITFGERSGKYFFTIIAHLLSNEDGSYTFEGLTGKQDFPVGESIDRLMAHWPGFTKAQEERNEADKLQRRGKN